MKEKEDVLILTRLTLNPAHPEAVRSLGDPYRLHSHLAAAAPGFRPLFRLEGGRPPRVLVASTEPLHLHKLPPGFAQAESKAVGPEHLRAGGLYRFRLRANPVRRLGRRKEGLLALEDQLAWLEYNLALRGARLLHVREARREGLLRIRKPGETPFSLVSVLYEGILQVENPAPLWRAEKEGIGPGKAFGFGLLSLAPLRW